jgi:hypothetical protein
MQSTTLNPAWLVGLFDACGWVGVHDTFTPHLYLCFRSRHRETFAHLCTTEEGWQHPIGVETKGAWWHMEVHGERIDEMLNLIVQYSPTNVNIAQAGLALRQQETQYTSDPRAILIGRKIAEKLSEINNREYPI